MNNMSNKAADLTGLPAESLRKEVAHGSQTDRNTRAWCKYGMSMRVGETPYFLTHSVRCSSMEPVWTAQ